MPSLDRIIINPAKPTHKHTQQAVNPNERMGSEKRVLFIAFFCAFLILFHAFFCWKFDLQPTFKNKKQHIDYITHATMCVRVFKCSFLILFFSYIFTPLFIIHFFIFIIFLFGVCKRKEFEFFFLHFGFFFRWAFMLCSFCACRWII